MTPAASHPTCHHNLACREEGMIEDLSMIMRKTILMKQIIPLFVIGLFFASSAFSAVAPVNKSALSGVAVKGYDPVAYFKSGKPVKGDKQFTLEHLGAKWRFSSQENLDLFKAGPGKYAPQYGGYCAWAVSRRYTASIDPEAWKIVEEKLYLNYSKAVQTKWEEEISANIEKANVNWPQLLNE